MLEWASPKFQFMSDSGLLPPSKLDFRGGPVWHLENFVILREAQSMYFNFLGRTRGGPVGILWHGFGLSFFRGGPVKKTPCMNLTWPSSSLCPLPSRCPSMLCHIILGFGRAWKGIDIWKSIVVGMPFPKHEIMFGRAFIREGHALPNKT